MMLNVKFILVCNLYIKENLDCIFIYIFVCCLVLSWLYYRLRRLIFLRIRLVKLVVLFGGKGMNRICDEGIE